MELETVHSILNICTLRSIVFQANNYTTNMYMISETIEYVNCFFEEIKEQHNNVNDVILKSALVYQYLHLRNFKTCISIDDVLELNNNEIGLIGPGNGCLTHLLERIFNQSDILHSHSILHDAFGRFYTHHSLDRGCTYAIPENRTQKCVKRSPLCGQISGLIYCAFNKITI